MAEIGGRLSNLRIAGSLRVAALIMAVALFATACGGGGGSGPAVDESKPPLHPDGPLRGLILAADGHRDGTIVDPRLAFTPDDTGVTAVVGLSDEVPEDSTLTVAWYRLGAPGEREHLFSKEIEVGPGGRAFSQASAPGGLPLGLYETVATLGEHQVRTPWVVPAGTETASPPSSLAIGALPLLLPRSVAQAGDHEGMIEGADGWWYAPGQEPGPPEPPSAPGPCEIAQLIGDLEPMDEAEAYVYWLGSCTQMKLEASVAGPPVTLASTEVPEGSLPSLHGGASLCSGIPGGSDLPGTVVHFSATGSEGATRTDDYTLPDYSEALIAAITSEPDAGSRVEPGDTIELEALAMMLPPALGIDTLKLYANEELIDSTGNGSGSHEPTPCDYGRYVAYLPDTSYEVPSGEPSPIIEICAVATGFDRTESRDCIQFYTGEVWEGSLRVRYSAFGDVTCTETFDGTVRFTVAGDGTIQGTGSVGSSGHTGPCMFTPHTYSLVVGGKATDDALQLAIGTREPPPSAGVYVGQAPGFGGTVPRSDDTASGSYTNDLPSGAYGMAQFVHTLDLECVSC